MDKWAMTKLEAVTTFVMDCISETVAGDFLEHYHDADWVQYVPDGDVEAYMPSSKEIEIAFGGDIYTVKITKPRSRSRG